MIWMIKSISIGKIVKRAPAIKVEKRQCKTHSNEKKLPHTTKTENIKLITKTSATNTQKSIKLATKTWYNDSSIHIIYDACVNEVVTNAYHGDSYIHFYICISLDLNTTPVYVLYFFLLFTHTWTSWQYRYTTTNINNNIKVMYI